MRDPTVPTEPEPPPEEPTASTHVYPASGAAGLIQAITSARPGEIIRVHGPYVYDIGLAELRPPSHGVMIVGDPAEVRSDAVYAPVAIIGSGKNVFDLASRHDITLSDLDIKGGVWQTGDASGQTGNCVRAHNEYLTLRRVKLSRAGVCGLSGQAVGHLLEDVEITETGFAPVDGICAGVKVTRGGTIRRAYVHRNHRTGLWADCQTTDWTVEDCRVEYNQSHGVFFEISGGAIIRRNTIRGNNPSARAAVGGLTITSSRDVVAEDNLFGGNGEHGIRAWNDTRAGNGATGSCERGHPLENVLIRRNQMGGDRLTGCVTAGVTCADNEP